MIDPNVYALSISLDFDASAAFKTLDEFEESLLSIEDKIANAAKNTITTISNSVKSITNDISKLHESTKQLNVQNSDLSDKFGDINAELRESNKLESSMNDEISKINEMIDDLSDNFEQQIELQTEINSLYEDLEKSVEDISSKYEDLFTKQLYYSEQLSDSFKNQSVSMDKNSKIYNDNIVSLKQIFNYMLMISQEAENFVTSNYRYYGSQQEILNQTRLISMEYGLLRSTAIEAMKALSDYRIPKDEIEKYTASVVKANRHLGVGIPTLASYAFNLKQINGTAANFERQMTFADHAMRKFGLNANEIDKILGNQKTSMAMLNRYFKGGANDVMSQAEKFKQFELVLTGIGKKSGIAAENMSNLLALDIDKATTIQNYYGKLIESEEDYRKALYATTIAVGKDVQAAFEIGGYDNRQREIKNIADSMMGFDESMIDAMATIYENSDSMEEFRLATLNLDKAVRKAYLEGINPFSDANNTLAMQFKLLLSNIATLIGLALTPLEIIFRDILKVVNALFWGISYTITVINDFYNTLKKTPGVGFLVDWVIYFAQLTAGAIVLIGVLRTLLLAQGFKIFGKLFKKEQSLAAKFFDFIKKIGKYIGDLFIAAFDTLGKALMKFGERIKPVVVPLLALGAALVLVSYSAKMFVSAVKELSEIEGWLAPLVALLGSFAVALVLIGKAAQSSVPGLLAVSGTMLSIGASAVMVGAGILLAGVGLKILIDSFMELIKVLSEVEVNLVELGGVILIAIGTLVAVGYAGPLLAAASVAFIGAAAALYVFAVILRSASNKLEGVPEVLNNSMDSLIEIGPKLIEVSSMILSLGIKMLIGGASLLAGVIALGVGAALMVPAGIAITAGAYALRIAISGWVTGIDKVLDHLVELGGKMLTAGTTFRKGITDLYQGAKLMRDTAGSLKSGVQIFNEIGLNDATFLQSINMLYNIGNVAANAAVSLLFGFSLLQTAAERILIAGYVLRIAVNMFEGIPEYLETTVNKLLKLGPNLLSMTSIYLQAGIEMLISGRSFLIGISALAMGAALMIPTSIALAAGIIALKLATSSWVTGIDALLDRLIMISQKMLIAGTGFYSGTSILGKGSDALSEIAESLRESSASLLKSMFSLMASVSLMVPISAAMIASSASLYIALMPFKVVSKLLSSVADTFGIGVEKIYNATNNLDAIIERITNFDTTMRSLIESLNSMSTINFDSFSKLPQIDIAYYDEFIGKISTIADKLSIAVDKLKKPIDSFVNSINRLQDTVDGFDLNVVENAVNSVSSNVTGRERELAPAEPITTVQVFNGTEGVENDQQLSLLSLQNANLESILEVMSKLEGSKELQILISLLESRLPDLDMDPFSSKLGTLGGR